MLGIPKQTFIIELEHEFAEKTKDFTSYCSLWRRQEMVFEWRGQSRLTNEPLTNGDKISRKTMTKDKIAFIAALVSMKKRAFMCLIKTLLGFKSLQNT